MGNRRCVVEVESNPNIVLYNEEREESCLLKTFILHFTFEINQTHGKEHIYSSLVSHEYSNPIFIIIIINSHTHFRLFFRVKKFPGNFLLQQFAFHFFE